MRLTTRKKDVLAPNEREALQIFAEHAVAWFKPETLRGVGGPARARREVLNELQRLGYIFPRYEGRPRGAEKGTIGYALTDTGRLAIVEMEKRDAAGAA